MSKIEHYFKSFPKRLIRLVNHLAYPFYRKIPIIAPPSGILEWFSDLGFYCIDTIAVPEIYESLFLLLKWNTRPLNNNEITLARSVFGNSINYNQVRIDGTARFGTKKMALAYVSFNTINYMKNIENEIFIHEMMHIWQYQHLGSIYIGRAIKAQFSIEGYDYGGYQNLLKVMQNGGKLTDFNFEQQADIIEDFYKFSGSLKNTNPVQQHVYQYFASQLLNQA